MNPRTFTIGPLHMMQQYVDDDRLKHIGSNLWKEDVSCINWLDTKDPGSVVYVNFGSIIVMAKEQLIEFGWGLANSQKDFLWITRPDIVGGDEAMMPPEFVLETKGRGMVTSWCPQEEVLYTMFINNFQKLRNKLQTNIHSNSYMPTTIYITPIYNCFATIFDFLNQIFYV